MLSDEGGRLRDHPAAYRASGLLRGRFGARFVPATWVWCHLCARAYPLGEVLAYREPSGEWSLRCGVAGCAGSPLHWHRWAPDDYPRREHPEYPAVPAAFGCYPL